ncbi:MAG: hypothetical protein PHN69_06550 [Candidatus Pacebacteria bacterium]|nr:hypothetical protein [Candidatus Paceibacterota bacterium]
MFICPKCKATNIGNKIEYGCECCGYMKDGGYRVYTTSGAETEFDKIMRQVKSTLKETKEW